MKKIYYFLLDIRNYFKFKNSFGAFRGVYDTFEEAIRYVKGQVGYDNSRTVESYLSSFEQRIKKINEYEYPMFFWLKNILDEYGEGQKIKIFDFGGNLGVHFFKFYKFVKNNKRLTWIVCEVPSIVKLGQERFSSDILNFTSNFYDADGCDIFFSSGAIQYIQNFSLSELGQKPKHIILARLPLQNQYKQFVTLQNGGTTFYPQYVFNKSDFIESLVKIDYQVIDEWTGRDTCIIPFHRDKSVYAYTGLYMKLRGSLE